MANDGCCHESGRRGPLLLAVNWNSRPKPEIGLGQVNDPEPARSTFRLNGHQRNESAGDVVRDLINFSLTD